MLFNLHFLRINSFILILLIQSITFSQVDFNDYKTLKSNGPIPNDFIQSTSSKIKENIKISNKSKSESKRIYQYLHLGIDKILNSGQVVYGDEVSNYVKNIARNLLKNEENIFNQLRFYTLKSNECNAFSTDQGIIFVTTGLIAQLENEAQLACVLAHEIAHFTEKHVLESFDFIKNKKKLELKDLNTYSKEKEFEADKIGIKWYNEAGYSEDELLSTFDVLLYSYLPFDEIEIPKNYFNTKNLIFPGSYTNFEIESITAIEDFDDSESSHPNIKKRKLKVEEEISNYSNWENNSYIISEETFKLIRNICRFEYLRSAMIKHDFEKVLYSSFLLEKEYPNSIYIEKMKAQVWYNLIKTQKSSDRDKRYKEGEIGFVYHFVKSLNKNDIYTLAIKNIYESKQKYPDNKMLTDIYKKLIITLSKEKKFNINDFSQISFKEAKIDYESNKNKEKEKDSGLVIAFSKYDKIKKNKIDNIYSKDFDSTTFYKYGIPELISDSVFLKEFKSILKNLDTDSIVVENNKSLFENYQFNKVILLNPYIASSFRERYNLSKSDKLTRRYSYTLQEITTELNVESILINFENMSIDGTTVFNDRNLLYNLLNQSIDQDFIFFSTDYDELLELTNRLKASKLIFTHGTHNIKRFMFIKRHTLLFKYYLIDINEISVISNQEHKFHGKPLKYNLGAHYYDFLFTNNQTSIK